MVAEKIYKKEREALFNREPTPEQQGKLDAVMKDYDANVTVPDTLHARIVENTELALVDDRELSVKPMFNDEQVALIKAKVAPNATQTEFELLMYMAQKYNLDPLIKQIWLVKFGDSPAQIYAGRDGYLEIAHRSGQFDGMETKVQYDKDGKIQSATCEVWRKDMTHSIKSEVLFKEYATGKSLWASKPAVMLGKVAESVALRKAFSVSGMYSPEEMGQ